MLFCSHSTFLSHLQTKAYCPVAFLENWAETWRKLILVFGKLSECTADLLGGVGCGKMLALLQLQYYLWNLKWAILAKRRTKHFELNWLGQWRLLDETKTISNLPALTICEAFTTSRDSEKHAMSSDGWVIIIMDCVWTAVGNDQLS